MKRIMKRIIFCLAVFVLIGSSLVYSQSLLFEKLDVRTLKLLMSGNKNLLIMQKRGKTYGGGERWGGVIVNASFEKCWSVVTDINNYKDFVPMMTESEVVSKKGNKIVGKFRVDVKFLGIGCTEKYQQIYVLDKAKKVIRLVDMKTNKVVGGWRFISIAPNQTIVLYQDIAPKIEEMCKVAQIVVKVSPDTELALHSSPTFVYMSAMKDRMEGKK